MRRCFFSTLLLACVLLAVPAAAQITVNPRFVEFAPSPDDAQVVRYEMGWFADEATVEPIQVADLGRPVCSPLCTLPLPARPSVGRFWARVRAIANDPELVSDWSEVSNPFGYAPLGPPAPHVRK